MIKWKQRLYAVFLRRVLGPFLDSPSQQILHESIDVSFQEGTFALSNIGLCTTYLNEKVEDGGVQVKKARIQSITIQLSLMEGRSSNTTTTSWSASESATTGSDLSSYSSLAWRAMNLGSTVALVAHIEINGFELEVQPLPRERRKAASNNVDSGTDHDAGDSSSGSDHDEEYNNNAVDDVFAQTKNYLSSYMEAALGSLRLTLNITNLSIRLCHQASPGMRSFIELRLPSFSYQDLDVVESSSSAVMERQQQQQKTTNDNSKTIFEKTMLFQGITVSAGESIIDGDTYAMSGEQPTTTTNLVSTIAMAEGTGQISCRAVEFLNNNQSSTSSSVRQRHCDGTKRVQQDIDVRVNQQVKVSVSETSLLQIQAVAQGFSTEESNQFANLNDNDEDHNMSASGTTQRELGSVFSASASAGAESGGGDSDSRMDEMELYTIDGIMKQYQEARQLAERNEMRGGILVPSNAFEEGENIGEGDPRTFDVFFDANDKSFHNYASMMKDSLMASRRHGGSTSGSDFVHTKLRLHLSGGGVKVTFRGRKTDTRTFLEPEEYVLLTFNDLEVTSRLSSRRVDLSFQVSHLEIDDAQILPTDKRRIEEPPRVDIGNLLCFGEPPQDDDDVAGNGDLLLQPACISMHFTLDSDGDEDAKKLNVELNLKPVEVVYRERTFSHLNTLATKLGSDLTNETSTSTDTGKQAPTGDSKNILNSALFTIASLTLTLPFDDKKEYSPLFARSWHSLNSCPSSQSALGFVFDNLSFEHKHCNESTAEGMPGMKKKTTTLDIHSFLVFASSPEYTKTGPRTRVIDLFGAAGRFEVDPFIPITFAYKRNVNVNPDETNVAKQTFPSVPAFSSFKARQEDDEDEEEIDRVLSEKLSNVDVDSRRALRAKDPQSKMLLEAENCEAAIMVHIPDIVLDLSKEELESLLVMLKCVMRKTENPETEEETSSPSASAVAVSMAIDSISFSILDKENHCWNSHVIRLDMCRAYTIIGGGDSSRFWRLLAHEATLFEMTDVEIEGGVGPKSKLQTLQSRALSLKNRTIKKRSASAVPIFYRSKLFPAISHTSPSILLDVVQPVSTGPSDPSEQSIFFSLYHMTYRCDPDSKWIERLQSFFSDLIPGGHQDTVKEPGSCNDDNASLTRVFLSLADCNLDYTSLRHFTTPSRSILRVGDLRFSSNIVKPAVPVQAFSLSMGDFSWYLCNTRASHNFENSFLPGGGHLMANKDLIFKPNQSRGTTTETVFRDMCFKTILTLESIDAIIVKSTTTETESHPLELTPEDPGLTISLTLGELSLYVCKDSFQCFTETMGELQTKLTAVSDEEMEEMKAQMTEQIKTHTCDQEQDKTTFRHGAPADSRIDVAAIPVDSEDDFMLDGYDWTTIDHAGRKSEIPPGEEQSARWFHASPVVSDIGLFQSFPGPLQDTSTNPSNQPRIISQHFPLQAVSDPLSLGDMEAPKVAGTHNVIVDTRILLHDLKLKVRFFDGYDWPEYQSKKKRDPKALFVIAEQSIDEHDKKLQSVANDDKKSALLGGLLAGGDQNAATFGDLPLAEERVRQTLAQHDLRRLSRRTSCYIQFSASGVSVRVDSFRESTGHRLKACLGLALKDFFLAETISNLNPVKMFGEWFNEVEHPRDSKDGLLMLRMFTWDPLFPLTPEKELASEECEVAVTLAPMRCILDQRAIQFAQAFFDNGDDEDPAATRKDWTADLNLIPAPFVRSLRVMPWKIKVDYTPQMIDTAALKNGSVIELLNLSPLDAMVLTLPQVEIENAVDFGEAIGTLIGRWLGDVKSTQLYKFLANARPFEPITTIGGGVADLFVLPWDAYKNGGNVSRALRSSVSSLVGNVAHETLTTSSRLTAYIANEMAKASNQSPTGVPNNSLPSRPLATPRRVGDTANHALESLARGVQTANYKVIIVPYREFRRSGTTGAVKSIARGIPVAIAAPVGGASEALSYTLLGARNQIRPDIRKEEEISKRGLHYGGI